MMHKAPHESMAGNPASIPAYCLSLVLAQGPWRTGSNRRCCGDFTFLCVLHTWTNLPDLTSTHQALPFLQVCKLMGRLVPSS